ncbi:MAG: hypothetical protein A2V65_04625 [Deltaproteobacteria bacterium RBG_13_49_15]|nr:MAG: hypothetical protein A2V65_04625 [Deltaproteobacteria bacterium RBG_13_49_15]
MKEELFLGIDVSTQSITAVLINPRNGQVGQFSLRFDDAFPTYGTRGGVLFGKNPNEVFVDPRMWAEALDGIFLLLKDRKLTGTVRALAVSAQQHGSVYLNNTFDAHLKSLDSGVPYQKQIQNVFSREVSPIWMDSSTRRECVEISKAMGGEEQVARITGSMAMERFTGPQIRKFWKERPQEYEKTAHIALVSSFITSLLIGRTSPVDGGDGYGTNLADIRTGRWSDDAMDATAPRLASRLPRLILKDGVVGRASPYLVERYGFNHDTEVIVGSGDNPCSLVGLGLIGVPDIHAISLGTSDTYFGHMDGIGALERSDGHIFGAADGKFMFLVCFKNGSPAREAVKNSYGLSWDAFSEILLKTPPGNQGKIILPYFLPEITPLVLKPRVRRFGGLREDDIQGNVRAVAEAQAMSMYLHSGWTGSRPKCILVTAGGSENRGVLTVISQVFGIEVRSFEVKESAALGAAVRAAHSYLNSRERTVKWSDLFESVVRPNTKEAIRPSPEAVNIYHAPDGLINVYEACERFALAGGENPQEQIRAFEAAFCDSFRSHV